MVPGIVLGFGIGLAAYACVKLLFGWSSTQSPPALSEPPDVLPIQEMRQEAILVEPAEESLSPKEYTDEASPEEHGEESLQEEQEGSEQYLDSASDTADDEQVSESKAWYLIATSKGLLRACKCSAPTSHTVAGPFATKRAAQQAKQQYDGRSPRPLGAS